VVSMRCLCIYFLALIVAQQSVSIQRNDQGGAGTRQGAQLRRRIRLRLARHGSAGARLGDGGHIYEG